MRASEQDGDGARFGDRSRPGGGLELAHDARARRSRPVAKSSDAYNISRLGRETLECGVARLAAGERLGVALHPRLAQRIEQQFLLVEFELTVFTAMKEVEVRVRELANETQSLLGVKLMQRAFSAEKGVLTVHEADPGERVAMMELFKGAIGRFKNPTSHRPVDYDDPTLASEVILFADLLLRLLDQVEERKVAAE